MALDAKSKRAIKNRKLAKSMIAAEPECAWQTKEEQDKGLGYALSWYSQNTNKKDWKKWTLEYYKSVDKSIYSRLKILEEWRFGTFGSVCRMMSNGGYKEEWSDSSWFKNKLDELLAISEREKVRLDEEARKQALLDANKPKPKTIQERIWDIAQDVGGEFDEQIDVFTTTGEFKTSFSAKDFLAKQGISSAVAAKVVEFFTPVEQELRDAYAGTDEQLVEGYSHLTRKQLKLFRDFVSGLVADTKQHAQSAKKPVIRKQRIVPPARRVAKLKYQRKEEELGLVSLAPTKILDTTEIWLYNTKYKKIICYVSDGRPLDVKGTSIIGFDVKKSTSLTLRKPDQFFKGLSIGKRALSNAIKEIKTKPTVPNGRVNENCILLGAF